MSFATCLIPGAIVFSYVTFINYGVHSIDDHLQPVPILVLIVPSMVLYHLTNLGAVVGSIDGPSPHVQNPGEIIGVLMVLCHLYKSW